MMFYCAYFVLFLFTAKFTCADQHDIHNFEFNRKLPVRDEKLTFNTSRSRHMVDTCNFSHPMVPVIKDRKLQQSIVTV